MLFLCKNCCFFTRDILFCIIFREVAQAALKEAIMMAQEAGDNVCLQLANAWMYNLTNEKKFVTFLLSFLRS